MTDFEFEILEKLYNEPHKGMQRTDLANFYGERRLEAEDTIKGLISKEKYLEQAPNSTFVKISEQGKTAYRSEKEDRDKKADEDSQNKKQQRFSNKLLVLAIVVPSVLTLVDIIINLLNLLK